MHWLENWLIPTNCVLTGEETKELDLSEAIIKQLKKPNKVCPQCCEHSLDSELCGACIATPPPFTRTQVGFYFEGSMIELIHTLKYQKQTSHARLLAQLLVQNLDLSDVEALIPVPAHMLRRRERGFNQAQLIAESLGKLLNIPVLSKAVIRSKTTPSQTGLSLIQRKQNLRSAFQADFESLKPYSKVALVDDVITTGATMTALAYTLKKASPELLIEAWAVAKTE